MATPKHALWSVLFLLSVGPIILVACTSAATETPTAQPVQVSTTPPTQASATQPTQASIAQPTQASAPKGTYLDRALAGEFKGRIVTATGPFVNADAQKFADTMKEFEDKTGITIKYQGSADIGDSIEATVAAGHASDIIDFTGAGHLASIATKGRIIDLSKYLDMDALKANYNPYWLDQATMDGPNGKILAGVWDRANGKGIVYYPKKAWDAAGYKVPTTYDELRKLMDQMVAAGTTPWCIGIASGFATGWVATDWIENILLRTTTPENYDAWVQGKLKFSSPEVTKAAKIMADIWQDKYVYGGKDYIVKTSYSDSTLPMFDAKSPKCFMNMNGSFIPSFFPKGLKADVDYGAFYFPPIDPQYGSPVEVGADIWAATADRPEVMAVMECLTKGEHLKKWMEEGGVFASHKDADLSWYGSDTDRVVGQVIANAQTVRFDGSDAMPDDVAGSFWTEMTNFVAGKQDLTNALKNIDDSWPK
jgi:alpha-glucoside transport system substrate-binding protein